MKLLTTRLCRAHCSEFKAAFKRPQRGRGTRETTPDYCSNGLVISALEKSLAILKNRSLCFAFLCSVQHVWFVVCRETIRKLEFEESILAVSIAEATATSAINECVAGLYAESIFIESDKAEHVALQGLLFLRRYAKLAKLAFERKQNRFPLTAKGHFLHHQFLELHSQSRSCRFCVNPLLYANQMSEDFVGKPSRLARRVSPKTTEMRVLQRTFLSIRNALCSSAGGCGGKL